MATLNVNNITKDYPTRAEPLRVLKGISFSLNEGDNVAILGPSGCGKSTLLQILGTLQAPTDGTLSLGDVNPFELAEPQLADFRNRQVGFIFQDHHLLPQLSALENVLVPAIAKGKPSAAQVTRARELLDRVGLSQRVEHRPAELSGGERQRVATARALINQPALLLADEPTGNLDRTNADQVADLLHDVQGHDEANRPILIVVTHSTELAQRFQQQWNLNDGQMEPRA